MRILVTGRQGQVVSSLIEAAAGRPRLEIIAAGRPELDLADPASVHAAIQAARPDIVVSAAAYTAVDQAEDEPEIAAAINERGAGAVAAAAAGIGAPVIHLSTDYVFSGGGERPYREDDPAAPIGVYGATKLAGERAVAAANPRHLILRTAWVYSVYGKNFVKTMLRLAADRDSLSVVADQWGNPTSAHDIADAIRRRATAKRCGAIRHLSSGRQRRYTLGWLRRACAGYQPHARGTVGRGPRDNDGGLSDKGKAARQFAALDRSFPGCFRMGGARLAGLERSCGGTAGRGTKRRPIGQWSRRVRLETSRWQPLRLQKVQKPARRRRHRGGLRC